MKLKRSSISLLSVLFLNAWILTGCGGASLSDTVKVNLDPLTQSAVLDVEMSDGTEISLNGEFPLPDNVGTLSFVPATRTENSKIRVSLNLASLAGNSLAQIRTVNTLPNGAPLPVAMVGNLYAVDVIQQRDFDVDAVFQIVPELQLGSFVGIRQFSSRYFPSGVSICQNFRNEQNLAFASVCLYGPGDNTYGGVFVGANLGDVLSLDQQPQALVASRAAFRSADQLPEFNLDSLRAISMESSVWGQGQHDPRNQLKGRAGYTALKNAEKILKK